METKNDHFFVKQNFWPVLISIFLVGVADYTIAGYQLRLWVLGDIALISGIFLGCIYRDVRFVIAGLVPYLLYMVL